MKEKILNFIGVDIYYVIKNTSWINLNTLTTTILSFITSLLFANFLSKNDYGLYQFILSISLILTSFTLTGMNAAVTSSVAKGFDGTYKKSIWIQIRFGIISFIFGILGFLYYLINKNNIVAFSILIIAVTLPIINSLNTWGAYLNGKKDFKSWFLYNQILNIINYGSIILAIIFYSQAFYIILISFISSTIGQFLIYKNISKKYKTNNLVEDEALDYGKSLSLSSVLPMITLNIDNLIIFHILGSESLAIYAFASNIPDRFMGFIRPISTIAMPKLSEKTEQEVKKILPRKIFLFFILASTLAVFYILISPILYKTFFPQYIDSIIYSKIYVIASLISTVTTLSITSLFATRSKEIFKYNIINPLFNILVVIIGGYCFGIFGVIFARIVGNTFSLLLSYFFTQR